MTWIRPRQGGFTSGGSGSGAGLGRPFIARVATTVGTNIVLAGGAPNVLNGVALAVNNVVLIKDQINPAENGLYRVDVLGTGANGTWTRIQALDSNSELDIFFAVYVREGLVDPDVIYTLTTDPPYFIGVTPLMFVKYPPTGGAGSSAVLSWGNDSVGTSGTTRYMTPWFEDDLAEGAPIYFRVPRAGTLKNLYVRHNQPGGTAVVITYTVQVEGVDTTLVVALANNAADGSNLINAVVVAAGDRLSIKVTKAALGGVGPGNIEATCELL